MGEAIVFTAFWQLCFLAGVAETEDIGLLAVLITVQQSASTLSMFLMNRATFRRYAKPGGVYAVFMAAFSPLGNYMRESLPSQQIRDFLAYLFLAFVLLKLAADVIFAILGKVRGAQARSGGASPGGAKSASSETPSTLPDRDEPLSVGDVCLDFVLEVVDVGDNSAQDDTANLPEGPALPVASTASTAARQEGEATEPAASDVSLYAKEPTWLLRALPLVGTTGGVLGGLAGLNGPPFILMVAFTGLDKQIARTVFPAGQALEVWAFRLPALAFLGRIRVSDIHLFCLCLVCGQAGLVLGQRLAPRVSQRAFERGILGFLVVSCLLSLGLLKGHIRALICLGLSFIVVASRVGAELLLLSEASKASNGSSKCGVHASADS